MLDELVDRLRPIPAAAAGTLEPLAEALDAARELMGFCGEGSKIFLVLEKDTVMKRFQEVSSQLEQALGQISFDDLDISDEVREQVELVHAQLKRAKERTDMSDSELHTELLSLYNRTKEVNIDPSILERLSEKLHLTTIADLKQESLSLHEMVIASGGGDPGEQIEKMSMLLKKIKDFVQTQDPEMGSVANPKSLLLDRKQKTAVIPDDFRCPISLDLMKDPVIVATGQTYERACIEKWLASGHNTCPTTQQKLVHTSLTPNYVLRSLIAQWCEANGIELPKRPCQPSNPTSSSCSSKEHANIHALLRKLSSPKPDDQRSAAGELRLLAKRNSDNRICIAEAGAIPLLINLLYTTDLRIQEHAVTALLNLSIHDDNKAGIVSSGAVPGIVNVLKNGSMEARENAAATLFSLSVVDEYKIRIGELGAIPALVSLLSEGTQRGKKDAATALFNLSIYQGNKGKAVRAGVVPLIMGLLTDPLGGMVEEAAALLAVLASHPEGKTAIGEAEAVPVLVEMIGMGSARSRENAAAVLLHLCSGEQQLKYLAQAQECGMMGSLRELAVNGTGRGKRKAVQLLERVSRFVIQQQEEQAQILTLAQAGTQFDVHDQVEHAEHPSSAVLIDR
ncbi:protein spotted leaf 11-like [Ananas comosus]|uniref:RING-type E3 ubiquitin transferase n=1 Tax=Ananas comosus TaxID=4615 RepID=A0A6P5FZP5_ANACO|nr:protein spotted leaf 11-like [Ananas comosus]